MFSPDSQFGYSLLDQSDQRKDQMDLQCLEKQYLQNINFLQERIIELKKKIEVSKVISDSFREYEIVLNAKLFKVFQAMIIYNPNRVDPEIGRLQEALRQINLSIVHAAKANGEIFTSYDEALNDLEEQEEGLIKTRLKLELLQPEVDTEEEQVSTYQPPRP